MSHDVSLRLYDRTGALVGALPDATSWQASVEFSDVGALTFEYPADGVNAAGLLPYAEVALVSASGAEYASGRYVILGIDRDRLDDGAPRKYVAKSFLHRLSTAVVYPAGGASSPATDRAMSGTPGAILGTLLDEALARGALAGLARDFTATTDSAGTPWPSSVSTDVKPGATLLSVARYFTDAGLVEFRTAGRTLQAYVGDGLGVDRTVAEPPVVLRHGQAVTEAPEQTSSERVAGVALVVGDEGAVAEILNPAPTTAYGRIETSVSASGVTDVGTLGIIGDATLLTATTPARQITVGLAVDGEGPVPLRDFEVGDWVWTVTGADAPERVRVRQIGVERGSDGDSATAVLNDRLLEQEIKTARRVESLTGGARSSGNAGTADTAPPTTDPTVPDGTVGDGTLGAPSTPTVSARLGVVTVRWDGNDENGDPAGTTISHVEVHVSATSGFTPDATTLVEKIGAVWGGGVATVADLPYNATRYVRLVMVDYGGDKSAASAEASVTVTPLVNTDLIGAVISSANFQGGAVDTAALASGAVDAAKLANDSVGSNALQTGAVIAGKISAGAVGATELAANSVVAGKIAANAVTAGTIAANAVTAGTIAANAITAGKIAAGAIDGQTITGVTITGSTVTGTTVQSAATGPRVALGNAAWGSTVYFYNSTGVAGTVYGNDSGTMNISVSGNILQVRSDGISASGTAQFGAVNCLGNLYANQPGTTAVLTNVSASGAGNFGSLSSSGALTAGSVTSNGALYAQYGTSYLAAAAVSGNISSSGTIYANVGGFSGSSLYVSGTATCGAVSAGSVTAGGSGLYANGNTFCNGGYLQNSGAPDVTGTANVIFSASKTLQRNTSSQRIKDEIVPLREADALVDVDTEKQHGDLYADYRDVLTLTPVQYQSLSEVEGGIRRLGFIAEDVAAKLPFAAVFEPEYLDGDDPMAPSGETRVANIEERAILAALLAVVKDQQAQIDALTQRVNTLEGNA